MDNRTIGQAAETYGLKKDTFQKRIIRAIQSEELTEIRQQLGITTETETGLKAPFTPELEALLKHVGKGKDPKPKAERKPKTDKYEPVTFGYSVKEIQTITPAPLPENPDSEQDKSLSDSFFKSEIIVLAALLILILSDGFSMSLLAGRTFSDNPLAYILFSVVGLIIGYSAISTTRAAHETPRPSWKDSAAPQWILLFAVFQTALHGSAFNLFGEWSSVVGRVLIVISIPLATASLTTTILKK